MKNGFACSQVGLFGGNLFYTNELLLVEKLKYFYANLVQLQLWKILISIVYFVFMNRFFLSYSVNLLQKIYSTFHIRTYIYLNTGKLNLVLSDVFMPKSFQHTFNKIQNVFFVSFQGKIYFLKQIIGKRSPW